MIKEAIGYKSESISTAQAEYDVFSSLYSEYKKSPALVRERLYLETTETILSSAGRCVYLPLNDREDNARILIAPQAVSSEPQKKEK